MQKSICAKLDRSAPDGAGPKTTGKPAIVWSPPLRRIAQRDS